MTNGQWNTQVLANLHVRLDVPRRSTSAAGAAIAMVIMLLVMPIMIWNISPRRTEMGGGADMATVRGNDARR